MTTAPATVISANGRVDKALLGASMWPVNAVSVRSMEMAATNRPWQMARTRALRWPVVGRLTWAWRNRWGVIGMGRRGKRAGGFDRPHCIDANSGVNDIIPSKIAMPHDVIFLLVPDFQLLDMSGPAAVFQTAGSAHRRRSGLCGSRRVGAWRPGAEFLRGRSPDSILARRAFRHAGGAGRRGRARPPSPRPCAGICTRIARPAGAWPASARAHSCWRPRACSTGGAPPLTGVMPPSSRATIRTCESTPTGSTSAMAIRGPRPALPPA